MCGRFGLTTDPAVFARLLGIEARPPDDVTGYNIAPGASIAVSSDMTAPHPGPDASGQAGASRDDATCVSNKCPGRGEKARRTNTVSVRVS